MNRLPYFFLGLCLFALVNVPREWADRWRGRAIALLAPAWQSVLFQTAGPSNFRRENSGSKGESEVFALRAQVDALQEWLLEEKRLQSEAELIATLLDQKESNKSDVKRRANRQKQLLARRYASIPAQVIFRDPSSWSSSLWIALGEEDNQAVGRTLISPNSPVLFGNSLVGVVEYVGPVQSRVRLITDAGLVPSVRAVRGESQNRELCHHVKNLLEHVRVRPDLFSSEEEQMRFLEMIGAFEERVVPSWEEESLAKGELCGCSAPLWRSRGLSLKGIGFNYDYADEEGPARDLHTGRLIGISSAGSSPLLKLGDLLVTSGLDGVFPAGIPVAIVTQISPLKEGSFYYELEAKPTAGDLHDLHTVFVLPPLGFSIGEAND